MPLKYAILKYAIFSLFDGIPADFKKIFSHSACHYKERSENHFQKTQTCEAEQEGHFWNADYNTLK